MNGPAPELTYSTSVQRPWSAEVITGRVSGRSCLNVTSPEIASSFGAAGTKRFGAVGSGGGRGVGVKWPRRRPSGMNSGEPGPDDSEGGAAASSPAGAD